MGYKQRESEHQFPVSSVFRSWFAHHGDEWTHRRPDHQYAIAWKQMSNWWTWSQEFVGAGLVPLVKKVRAWAFSAMRLFLSGQTSSVSLVNSGKISLSTEALNSVKVALNVRRTKSSWKNAVLRRIQSVEVAEMATIAATTLLDAFPTVVKVNYALSQHRNQVQGQFLLLRKSLNLYQSVHESSQHPHWLMIRTEMRSVLRFPRKKIGVSWSWINPVNVQVDCYHNPCSHFAFHGDGIYKEKVVWNNGFQQGILALSQWNWTS